MIFPIALIATLFLTQIARAVPQACYYPTSPEPSTPEEQFRVTAPKVYTAKYDSDYDVETTSVDSVACSELVTLYSNFVDVPFFPHIGGAFDTTKGSPHCGAIWKLTNHEKPDLWVDFISIDTATSDFGLSNDTFHELGGNSKKSKSLLIHAKIVGHLEVPKG